MRRNYCADGQYAVEQRNFGHWRELDWEDARLTASDFPSKRLTRRTDVPVCPKCGGQVMDDYSSCSNCE